MQAVLAQDTFEQLGVARLINAFGPLTRFGGSLMDPRVIEAMAEASRAYVDIIELQTSVGERLAELTRNEAAFVTTGASAGILLATAACISAPDARQPFSLPLAPGRRNQVIMHRCHRYRYDVVVPMVGAEIIEVGYAGAHFGTQPAELESAFTERTAAVLYVVSRLVSDGALPLETVIELAHRHQVPVIVDAAGEVPPRANLWGFTQAGVDLAIFSGGKAMAGPQPTGLVLGRKDLVDVCQLLSSPRHNVGRALKVGKEELVGVLRAVELFLERSDEDDLAAYDAVLDRLTAGLIGVQYAVDRQGFVPHLLVPFADTARRDRAIEQLRSGQPPIVVDRSTHEASLRISPSNLSLDEASIVAERVKEVYAGPGRA